MEVFSVKYRYDIRNPTFKLYGLDFGSLVRADKCPFCRLNRPHAEDNQLNSFSQNRGTKSERAHVLRTAARPAHVVAHDVDGDVDGSRKKRKSGDSLMRSHGSSLKREAELVLIIYIYVKCLQRMHQEYLY